MIIKKGLVFTENGIFEKTDITTDGAFFTEQPSAGNQDTLNAEDCYVIPGLVDIHFHGCVGYDFCDGTIEAFDAIAEYQAKNGTTSICPATMTLARSELRRIFSAAGNYKNNRDAILCGINMEGPFLSLAKKGAQNGTYLHKPDTDMFREMQELSGGLIKHVAIAPEEDKNYKFIESLKDEVVLSIAHTTADYDTAKEAFQKGASHVTHLYNAMPPYTHREPGVIGAAADNEHVYAELITDGVHIHPSAVRSTFKLFGDDRICLISDSMMACGMPDGEYSLGGQKVFVKGKRAELKDGTIAGSASNLMDCLRTAVKDMGIPLESAIKCATVNPAKSIGIYNMHGSITPGKYANAIILNKNLDIKQVICRGTPIL